ncbi:sugar phosphate isomerase/epimerase [Candidatus Poribacteria bacterium]|jgi:sugar phosphate isomerase/epimerase|nr:sugar phosphate isomerase/epimerase [Candidatus Poribacteria bacterium]MBT5535166.1 sugar phosphate isomerase/epimerase [Candidatus Poribacteria bacterium]MBT5709510.1 sugar phosphate isomerase/epimerase [Candidatus Poribacteria bacterium]MBT7099584.1 sugar phosphate isomerase/epimerase [Candidatus Poribacteria bacterium]MBT7808399.1 sugar phosphate isomerase/epimerase [Candidatus Poribacteria bacterium]
MELGFLTPFSEDALKVANEGPFTCIEIGGSAGWIDDAAQRESAKKLLAQYDVRVASFMTLGPSIRTSKAEMAGELDRIGRQMDMANEFGGAVLTGAAPMGYDPSKSLADNVALFKEVYSPVADLAEAKGVNVAFENWPGGRGPFGEGGNLTVTPEAIAAMFEAVPSQRIGLEFDPSHFIWQGIDSMKAVREFIDRIHIIHAKDTEIYDDQVAWRGTYSRGWWRYRLPGFAKFDWPAFFALFYELEWDGDIVIEHEDGSFEGDRRALGFLLSGNYLKKSILE